MALTRRTGQRFQASIWPGFVDAMTGLLLVLMFVLTIFTVMQFVLSDILTGKDSELSKLSEELTVLAGTLGAERLRTQRLTSELDTVNAALQSAEASLAAQREQVSTLLQTQSNLEERLAAVLVAKAALEDREQELLSANAGLDAEVETLLQDKEALEAARAAAAAALIKSKAENAQVAATAEELRKRLEESDAEISVMALNLEAARAEAEEVLTLLAASQAAEADLNARLAAALADTDAAENISDQLLSAIAELEVNNAELTEQMAAALAAKRAAETQAAEQLTNAEERAILLAQAQKDMREIEAASSKSARQVAALNVQVSALNAQLSQLQSLFDAAKAEDSAKDVRIESLGTELNTALAKLATEQKRRLALEEAARLRAEEDAARLAEEAKDLAKYRSEFFGRLREVLADEDSIQIRGDRFVFSSEVLFDQGSATLSAQGEAEVAKVAGILKRISREIPDSIPWVIRVDGHTDNVPLSGTGEFQDNWELSQARALSVVRYLAREQGVAQKRLAANGFGEFQPVALGNSAAARAQNRRIELKLTER